MEGVRGTIKNHPETEHTMTPTLAFELALHKALREADWDGTIGFTPNARNVVIQLPHKIGHGNTQIAVTHNEIRYAQSMEILVADTAAEILYHARSST